MKINQTGTVYHLNKNKFKEEAKFMLFQQFLVVVQKLVLLLLVGIKIVYKTILVNNSLLPSNVILDANFLDYNYSRLLYSVLLMLAHTLEGFVSVIENSFLNNSVFDSMKIILSIFSELNNGQQNLKTIENLCYASYQAGIIQNHCSVGITHSFAHQLSSFGVSHGVANALFLSM